MADGATAGSTDTDEDRAADRDTEPGTTRTRTQRPAKAPVKAPARPGGSTTRGGRRPPAGQRGKRGTRKAERARLAARRRALEQRRLRQLRTASMVLAVILVLGAAGTAVGWWRTTSHDEVGAASDQATSAARSAVPVLLSYDYRDYDGSVRKASRYLSGGFATDYRNNMADLRTQAIKLKAQVTAQVTGTSVVTASRDRVVLLVFVDQYRQNSNIDGQKVDQDRVVLTMKHRDNGWKVIKLIAV